MKANAKLVAKRKVRNITDSTIVQAGMKSGAISQRPAGSGNKKARTPRKWESEKLKSWGLPAEGFKGHFTKDGWSWQESGEHVVGQWRNWIMIEESGLLRGMYGSVEAELEVSSVPSRGRSGRHSFASSRK